jgi:hypothetical protein
VSLCGGSNESSDLYQQEISGTSEYLVGFEVLTVMAVFWVVAPGSKDL